MDPSVIRAMARWPNVPEVFDWLSLDRRGTWRLRGVPFKHPNSIAFINRHYACDGCGRWYFQNGPQRVFVNLDYTPWVWSLNPEGNSLLAHTGEQAGAIHKVMLDEEANCLLATEKGIGLLIDADLPRICDHFRLPNGGLPNDTEMEAAIEALANGTSDALYLDWKNERHPVKAVHSRSMSTLFRFNPSPSRSVIADNAYTGPVSPQ